MHTAKSPCNGAGRGQQQGWRRETKAGAHARQVHPFGVNRPSSVRCALAPTTACHHTHLQQLLPHVEQHGQAEAQQAVGAARRVRQQRVPQAQRIGEGKFLGQAQRDPPAKIKGWPGLARLRKGIARGEGGQGCTLCGDRRCAPLPLAGWQSSVLPPT